MNTITIFLASSNELKTQRDNFEIEINRKNKVLKNKGIFLHLDIWEDLSSCMSDTRSQDEYNKRIKQADVFVMLAYSKVGMYAEEEFETAFGNFKSTQKPFIFTYFQDIDFGIDKSLSDFKDRLSSLGHFYATYSNFDNLWNQFNKELDRLVEDDFKEFKFIPQSNRTINQGDKSTYIEEVKGNITLNIQ